MKSFQDIARLVVAFESEAGLCENTSRKVQMLGDKGVHVLVGGKRSHILDFETASAAKIAKNLLNSGSAEAALASVGRSGSANPLEARMYGHGGW